MEAATAERPAGAVDGDTPLAGEDPGEDGAVHPEVVLEGDGQLSLTIGGKRPTDSKVVIRGGQIPFQGQAMKGDHVTLRLECRVAAVHVIDKIDSKTREVVETTRKHVLKTEGVELIARD